MPLCDSSVLGVVLLDNVRPELAVPRNVNKVGIVGVAIIRCSIQELELESFRDNP